MTVCLLVVCKCRVVFRWSVFVELKTQKRVVFLYNFFFVSGSL